MLILLFMLVKLDNNRVQNILQQCHICYSQNNFTDMMGYK